MKNFRNLTVWQKAHQLTLAIYKATRAFPREELYGLTSQTRRACASIPANIAQGCSRKGDAGLARFSHIAMGSASELEYQVLLTHDLGLIKWYHEHSGRMQKLGKIPLLNAFATYHDNAQALLQNRNENDLILIWPIGCGGRLMAVC